MARQDNKVTVLVVDDQQYLLQMLASCLHALGFAVLPCLSPSEALDHWRREHDRVDLLVTDLHLAAEISGADLARTVMAQKPSLKVIYMSGGHRSLLEGRWSDENCLEKPFSFDEFERMVKRLLSQSRAASGGLPAAVD